jgi:hypothetical protein
MRIPVGIGPPNELAIPIASFAGNLDLTTVTGVLLKVWRPDGRDVSTTWTATPSFVATTPIAGEVTYPFVGDELSALGEWSVAPYLEVPGGQVPCRTVHFQASIMS